MAKPIIAKDAGRAFVQHPAGQYRFVCADVYDEGERTGPFGVQHQIRLVFVSEIVNPKDEEGRPFEHSEWFNLSLNEKSNLRKFLESWRGLAFTEQEIREGWNVSRLVGVNAFVQVVHKPKKDGSGTRAVISTIMRLPKGMTKMSIPADFEPIEERVAKKAAAAAAPPAPASGAGPGLESSGDFDDFHRDEEEADDESDLPF